MSAYRNPDQSHPLRPLRHNLFQKISRKLWLLFIVGLVLLTSGGLAFAQPAPPSSSVSISGVFTTVWGDPPPGTNLPATTNYYITDSSNTTTRLLLDPALLEAAGGSRALDRRRVKLRGTTSTGPRNPISATPVINVDAIEPETGAAQPVPAPAAVSGSKPYINILCKFPDKSANLTPSTYFNGLLGDSYPGLSQYWRETSYNNVNLVGSATTSGWYTLPHPQNFYVSSPGQFQNANLDQLAKDCTAAAEAEVYFPTYFGINMMFNDILDCCAWGGSQFLTLDGTTRVWPITWMPPWGWQAATVLAHEQGHSFGLPHSADVTGYEYGNPWDVMSSTYAYCNLLTDPTYGCLGQGTISYHKDVLGWIPPAQKFVYSGVPQTITLERLTQPTNGNYVMAQIPIAGSSSQFYTVEARRKIGYDVKLPVDGVIIHKIVTNRSAPAWLPVSVPAVWTPGQTFTDSANNISVIVVSATATGFVVTIGAAPAAPSNLTATTITANQIDLNWTDNSNIESGFRIERKTGANGTWGEIFVTGPNVTTYSDTSGLALDTEYYYQVRAYNAIGNSAYSNTGSAFTPPNAPSGLNVSASSSTQVNLGWTNNSVTATGNRIERAANPAGPWTEIATVGPNITSYVDLGRSPDATYYYRIRAYNAGGNSAYSSSVSVTMPPAEPSKLVAKTISASQIDLSWQNNSATATGFVIERRTGTTGAWSTIFTTSTPTPTTYSDSSGLSAGTLYYYRVRAYKTGVGNSGPSNLASTVTTSTLQVTKTRDDGSANTLSWAIAQANAGPVKVITFDLQPPGSTIIDYAPASNIVLPTVQPGVTIGGICGANGAGIIIDGTNAPASTNGLVLNGGTTIYGLNVQNFQRSQIKALKPNNVEICVKAIRKF